jgi:hypothetical protein
MTEVGASVGFRLGEYLKNENSCFSKLRYGLV